MSESSFRLAVTGVSGRMGRAILEAYALQPGAAQLVVALDRVDSHWIGQDVGALIGRKLGVNITSDINVLSQADVWIDFTRPEATVTYLEYAQHYRKAMVIGTTGFSEAQKAQLNIASQSIPILHATNMGRGVNATFSILAHTAKVLGPQYDVEIIEMHHKHKVDAPSGTALTMGETIAQAWGTTLDVCAVYSREGITGERKAGTIGFSAVRAGDIVGEHTVIFAGMGERIEITHRAMSRSAWANGALHAASFLYNKPAGAYSMREVVGV